MAAEWKLEAPETSLRNVNMPRGSPVQFKFRRPRVFGSTSVAYVPTRFAEPYFVLYGFDQF